MSLVSGGISSIVSQKPTQYSSPTRPTPSIDSEFNKSYEVIEVIVNAEKGTREKRFKDGRKEIHSILKKFPNIDSNTTEADGVKYIEARPKKHFKGGGRRDWPRERPKYLHFTLYKENMDPS